MKFKWLEIFFIAITLILAALATNKWSNALPKTLPQYIFAKSTDIQSQIDKANELASQTNKKLMLVLGAEWCKDSRYLAAHFSSKEMQEVLTEQYETVFIDVGFFEDYHAVVQEYDYPAYFGTPTVLIIEPEQKALMNRTSIRKWLDAANVKQQDYIDYFSNTNNDIDLSAEQPDIQRADILKFIETNSQIVIDGFKHLEPIWAAVRTGETKDASQLGKVATELWEFRSQAQKDIQKIYKMVLAGKEKEVVLPTYDEVSW